MKVLRALLLILVLLFAVVVAAFFQWNRSPGLLSSIQERLGGGGASSAGSAAERPVGSAPADPNRVRVSTAGLDDRSRRFYGRREGRPAWLGADGRPNEAARAMMDAVRRAPEEGLDAADYDVASLDRALAVPTPDAGQTRPSGGAGSPVPASDPASLDAQMTALFLLYASDVATGRVDPRRFHEDWHLPANTLDVVMMIDDGVNRNRMAEVVLQLPPPHPEYARLKKALTALRAEAVRDQPTSLAQPSATRIALRTAARAPARQAPHGSRRGPRRPATPTPPPLPLAERIRRVTLSMERWRWVPRQLGNPGILINLPAFRLDVRENGQSVLAMRIVAGKSFSPTPVFSDTIMSIVFHPAWNIPDGIARDEILPAAMRDRGYLRRKGIHVLNNFGENAHEIALSSVREPAPGAKLPVALRQDPGPENPLGRIKFLMPNEYDIYLHDTPAGRLFAQDARALSHGCIRVEKPVELAEYLLQGTEWDKLRITSAMEEKDTQEVRLDRPMPVTILYMTAWVDETGAAGSVGGGAPGSDDAAGIHFGDDIYGLDSELTAMLSRSRDERAGRTPGETQASDSAHGSR